MREVMELSEEPNMQDTYVLWEPRGKAKRCLLGGKDVVAADNINVYAIIQRLKNLLFKDRWPLKNPI